MREKRGGYRVVVSDVIEPEQEKRVIDLVQRHAARSRSELEEYFKTTDTIELEGLTRGEAESLEKELEALGVTVGGTSPEQLEEEEKRKVRCPECGAVIEGEDWRCPECYHEFSDFEFDEDE